MYCLKKTSTQVLFLIFILKMSTAVCQINISAGDTLKEDFDGIGTNPVAILPSGWRADNLSTVRTTGTFSSAGDTTQQNGGISGISANGIYNFGDGIPNSATDRAVGFLSVATAGALKSGNLYVNLKNSGPAAIYGFRIIYDVEKYRNGMNSAGFHIQLYYSFDDISYLPVGDRFYHFFPADADNNHFDPTPGQTVNVNGYFMLPDSLFTNQEMYFSWHYSVASGNTSSNSQALGIDNILIIPNDMIKTPSSHVTSFSGLAKRNDQIELNWTDAQGTDLPDGYLVRYSNVSFMDIADPVDGIEEPDGISVINVNPGLENVLITGLDDTTAYYFKIFPYAGGGALIKYKIDGTVPQYQLTTFDNYTMYYYRSSGSGNWQDISNWEMSPDNSSWQPALYSPENIFTSTVIQSPHNVEVTTDITTAYLHVQNGAILNWSSGRLTINDQAGDDMVVEGKFVANGLLEDFMLENTATVLIKSGGIFEVSANATGKSPVFAGSGSSGKFFYETDAVFFWNFPGATIFSTANQVYFPDADGGTSPVFRVGTSAAVGANSLTRFNGVLHVMPGNSLTFQNSGLKIIRDGIWLDGNLSQNSSSGKIVLSGTESFLKGNGVLTLDASGLLVPDTVMLSLQNDITVNIGEIDVEGIIDLHEYKLSGSGGIKFNENSVLLTGHSGGINDAITLTGNRNFDNGLELVFNAQAVQNTGFPSGMDVLSKLSVNNSAGLVLNKDITITGQLEILDGIFDTDVYTIELGGNASMIEGANAYVLGNMKAERTLTNSSEDFGAIGLEITAAGSAPGNTNIKRVTGTSLSGGGTFSIKRYFEVIPSTNSNLNATIVFTYNENDLNGIQESNLQLFKSTDNGLNWTALGGTVNTVSKTINFSGLDGFSIITAGDFNVPLPVELILFTAEPYAKDVRLSWSTASEINNSGFRVMRSFDGDVWDHVTWVQGMGNNDNIHHYSCVDRNILGRGESKIYYMLIQVDYDGTSTSSDIVMVRNSLENVVKAYYDGEKIKFKAYTDEPRLYYTKLLTICGKLLIEKIIETAEGHSISEIPLHGTKGVLLFKISAHDYQAVEKLWVY